MATDLASGICKMTPGYLSHAIDFGDSSLFRSTLLEWVAIPDENMEKNLEASVHAMKER